MKSMMKKISFAAIFFALAMFVAAPVAHATTVSEVQAMITSFKNQDYQTSSSPVRTAETKDRSGLTRPTR